jgi:methylthioribose-1-phosphate isomerase
MTEVCPIEWLGDRVRMLDQTRLPDEVCFIETADPERIAAAIRTLAIRGAPAIGIAAGFALALQALHSRPANVEQVLEELEACAQMLRATRPTAVNLFWAIDRVLAAARNAQPDPNEISAALIAEALAIQREDLAACRRIGDLGAALLPDGCCVLTHCNTGGLATAGHGTALGVIVSAHREGKSISVRVTETRPLLQGSRLTAWELNQHGIPYAIICDSAAAHFMHQAMVDAVIVGADRIAANGDTANKVGTYSLAVLAKEHAVPFYVAAPCSTIDLALPTGKQIPIEERDPQEVLCFRGRPVAPEGSMAANPAFDVTPARFITAIITERGIARPPLGQSLKQICSRHHGPANTME